MNTNMSADGRRYSQGSTRRNFLVAGAATVALPSLMVKAATNAVAGKSTAVPHYCVFEKFLQDLSYGDLADALAEMGFDGVEATVRQGGHIAPEQVAEELPKMHAAFQERGMAITLLATDINRVDDPLNRKVLTTAAELGIPRYRLRYYFYDPQQPVWDQLETFRSMLKELAAFNGELGIQGLYQNHCGERCFGATIWDIYEIIKELPREAAALAFDIRNVQIEAGLAWTTLYRLVREHVGALYVKDYKWNSRKVENAPLGTSVSKEDVQFLVKGDFNLPISLHVEYLPDASLQENLAANRRDFALLKQWIDG